MNGLKSLFEVLYSVAGPLGALAYLPQIVTLFKDQSGAKSTSLITWFMWVVALTITTVYAGLVNGDSNFLLASGSSLTGTVLVFLLASFKRWAWMRKDKLARMQQGGWE